MSFFSQFQQGKPHKTRVTVEKIHHDFPVLTIETKTRNIFGLNPAAAEMLLTDDTHVNFTVDPTSQDTILFCFVPSGEEKGQKLSLKNTFQNKDFSNSIGASLLEGTEYRRLERVTSFTANTPDGRSTVRVEVPTNVIAFKVGDKVSAPVSDNVRIEDNTPINVLTTESYA